MKSVKIRRLFCKRKIRFYCTAGNRTVLKCSIFHSGEHRQSSRKRCDFRVSDINDNGTCHLEGKIIELSACTRHGQQRWSRSLLMSWTTGGVR